MEYRLNALINRKVSLLGFGCMRLPKLENEEIDYVAGFEMIDYAYQNGVNYFDTAWPYHGGKSELFIGEALKKYPRESFYLADKLPIWLLEKAEDVEKTFNEQLKKCQVAYFDYYLMHAMNLERFEKAERLHVYETLSKLKVEGKIKNLGFSFHDEPATLQKMLDAYPWDFVQIQFNYLDYELQNAKLQYEMIENKKIKCIIMEPIRGGALATLSDDAVKIFKTNEPDKSIASWALRFAGSQKNVLVTLSGMSNFSNVKDNIDTMNDFKYLDIKDYQTIEMALAEYKKASTIPCTGCNYCSECPSHIVIPQIFKCYNDYLVSKDVEAFNKEYHLIQENNKMAECINCKKCMGQCPQKINIPHKLDEIATFFEYRK